MSCVIASCNKSAHFILYKVFFARFTWSLRWDEVQCKRMQCNDFLLHYWTFTPFHLLYTERYRTFFICIWLCIALDPSKFPIKWSNDQCTDIYCKLIKKATIFIVVVVVPTVLGSIPASSDTVESEGRQMKQCKIFYIKRKIPNKTF
jgi:hypothetical protein